MKMNYLGRENLEQSFSIAKKLNGFIFLLVMSCLLSACATDSDKAGSVVGGNVQQLTEVDSSILDQKPTLDQLLQNQQSMTAQLDELNADMTVDVLSSGGTNKKFRRVVSIKLDGEPVLVGVSKARKTSPYFVKVLKNANTTPIGRALFAKGSKVKRDNMQISEVKLSSIKEGIVKGYLYGLGYGGDDMVYKRVSTFHYKKQSMQLIEYILPSINQFLD